MTVANITQWLRTLPGIERIGYNRKHLKRIAIRESKVVLVAADELSALIIAANPEPARVAMTLAGCDDLPLVVSYDDNDGVEQSINVVSPDWQRWWQAHQRGEWVSPRGSA